MNAIAWSQFQIAGGWKWLLWSCGIVAVALPVLVLANAQSDPAQANTILGWWLWMILTLQGLLLLVVIPMRVFGAMKRDRTQKLIESHRLMPLSATRATLGYIVGPNLTLLAVVATVMLVGIVISIAGGRDVVSWLAQHAMLGILGLMMCCVSAFFGQAVSQVNPMALAPLLSPVAMLGMGLLPAWMLILTPLQGAGLYAIRAAELPLTTFFGFAAQVLFGLVFFVGAARRYRRDDKPALGVWWGLGLLLLWVCASLLGVMYADEMRGGMLRVKQDTVVFVASLAASMLLAIGPVASASAGRIEWARRALIDPHNDERKPVSVATTAVLATGVVALLLLVAPAEIRAASDALSGRFGQGWGNPMDAITPEAAPEPTHYLLTAAVVLLFAGTIALLTTLTMRIRMSPVKVNIAWVLLTWGVGPLVDLLARVALAGGGRRRTPIADPTLLTWSSPPGTLWAIWTGELNSACTGLSAQFGLLVLVVLLLGIRARAARRRSEVSSRPIATVG